MSHIEQHEIVTGYKDKIITQRIPVYESIYTVTLNQHELNVLTELAGSVTGGGPIRVLTDNIWQTLKEYRNTDSLEYLKGALEVRSKDSLPTIPSEEY